MSSISSIDNPDDSETNASYLLPDIDLTNWKVTLPIGNPTSVTPPEILDYATNVLKLFAHTCTTIRLKEHLFFLQNQVLVPPTQIF